MRLSRAILVTSVSFPFMFVGGPGALHHHHHRALVDARHIEFTASPDHDTVDKHGHALLDRYALEIFLKDGRFPVQIADLGKPEADGEGTIRVDFVSRLRMPLMPGVTYEAAVAAVGPYGASESERSNAFVFRAPPCDPWISPTSMEFSAAGGPSGVRVNAGERCNWTAVSNTPWITILDGARGDGHETVIFRVAPNPAKAERNGTLTIAGETFRVNQDGAKNAHPR
jgi:hypothetical protein